MCHCWCMVGRWYNFRLLPFKSFFCFCNISVSLDKHVAFKAHFSASTLHVPGNAAYKFDSLIFNDGDAYNPVLGVFTAPYDGMYIFSAQLFAHANEILLADLMVNGAIVSRWALRTERLASGEREQSSITTVTVKLSEGDTVWVQQSISTPMDIFGSVHSFFTGALLYAY